MCCARDDSINNNTNKNNKNSNKNCGVGGTSVVLSRHGVGEKWVPNQWSFQSANFYSIAGKATAHLL